MPKQSKVSQAGPKKEDRAELAKRRSSVLTIFKQHFGSKNNPHAEITRSNQIVHVYVEDDLEVWDSLAKCIAYLKHE